ncbi:hypothetical protein BGZ61DRAFT_144416 [Ilyonectria robusta]|uniref:uncharacterized protein n=1 Tax=Ilyonectria robusta TaxID=1079257 RepID=UPI001E8D6331|nr:uncharacterized protein BGZ61DRAFT_144416 [Ilyonectria robusta]KAH8662718.1 hypothetical protein BGZ61DRAFT_144416 [Ilyonectria robusta]
MSPLLHQPDDKSPLVGRVRADRCCLMPGGTLAIVVMLMAASGVNCGLVWPGQSRCVGRQGSQGLLDGWRSSSQQQGWANCLERFGNAMQTKQNEHGLQLPSTSGSVTPRWKWKWACPRQMGPGSSVIGAGERVSSKPCLSADASTFCLGRIDGQNV